MRAAGGPRTPVLLPQSTKTSADAGVLVLLTADVLGPDVHASCLIGALGPVWGLCPDPTAPLAVP